MASVGVLFGTLLVQLPVLAVLVVGLVLLSGARRHRLPPRGAALARAGLLVMLAELALGVLWSTFLPFYLSRISLEGSGFRAFGLINGSAQFLLAGLLAAGLGLLVAALLTDREPAPPFAAPPPGPFPQPGPPQVPHPPFTGPGGSPSPGPGGLSADRDPPTMA